MVLVFMGFGVVIIGLLFISGINLLWNWWFDLFDEFLVWVVLFVFGVIGGMVLVWLIINLFLVVGGVGIIYIMGFLCYWLVLMGFWVGLVKLVVGIIVIGLGFFLGLEGFVV